MESMCQIFTRARRGQFYQVLISYPALVSKHFAPLVKSYSTAKILHPKYQNKIASFLLFVESIYLVVIVIRLISYPYLQFSILEIYYVIVSRILDIFNHPSLQ